MRAVSTLQYRARVTLSDEFFLLAIPTLFFVIISFWQQQTINNDVAIIIHETFQFLAGGNYVSSFYETNPPLILYLNIPVCLLSQWLGLNAFYIFWCYVASLALVSGLTCYALMKQLLHTPLPRYITYFSLLFVFYNIPSTEFGEREHLACILIAPYLFATALALYRKPINQNLAFFIGLSAGFGFALKPHFLVPLCLIEIYFIVDRFNVFAWIRTESLTIFSVMLLYVAAIWAFNPDYINVIWPLVKHYYFTSIPTDIRDFYRNKLLWTGYTAIICNFIFYYAIPRYNKLVMVLALNQIGFMVAVFAGISPWYYHVVPTLAFAIVTMMLCSTLIAAGWLEQGRITFSKPFIAIMVISFFYFMCILTGRPLLCENLLMSLKYLIFLGMSVIATLLVATNKKLIPLALVVIGLIFYNLGNIVLYEMQLFLTSKYYFLIIYSVIAWTIANIGICLLAFTRIKLNWVPAVQKSLAFALYISFILFFPTNMLYLRYIQQTILAHHQNEIVQFLAAQPNKGSISCISSLNPSICTALAYYLNRDLVGKFPSIWWVNAIARPALTLQHQKDKKLFMQVEVDDLNNNKPQWIIIYHNDSSPGIAPMNFFRENKDFQNAWSHYKLATTIPKTNEHAKEIDYEIYERKSV
jgi:hypothetical protein